jgi:predicted  nucleic acid-binding Zn-ribbon protein
MAESIKFTAEELKSLQEIQNQYQTKTIEFGQMKVQKILLTQQLDSLERQMEQMEVDYTNIQQTERELVKTLNEKYGPGSLDPSTGTFTPVQEPPKANQTPQI